MKIIVGYSAAALIFNLLIQVGCSAPKSKEATAEADPYLWLEDAHSEKALDWVKNQNDKSLTEFKGDTRYSRIETEERKIILDPDRLPSPSLRKGFISNFWQDSKHVRGILRQTTLKEYQKRNPKWDLILDIDELAKKENENWVFHGAQCLPPVYRQCMVSLSRGGGDAKVEREFDYETKKFIEGGFFLPEAKSDISWFDEDTLIVGTDFGKDSLTESGYPRIVKKWKRGTPLVQAETLYEGLKTDVGVSASVMFRPEGKYAFIERSISRYSSENWMINAKDFSKKVKIEIPNDAVIETIYKNLVFVKLRSDWQVNGITVKTGTLVSFNVTEISNPKPNTVYEPGPRTSFDGLSHTKNHLFIETSENVNARVYLATASSDGNWKLGRIPLPDAGTAWVSADSSFEDGFLLGFSSFLKPKTFYLGLDQNPMKALKILKTEKSYFKSSSMQVEQFESESLDGTAIPYFLVRKKGAKLNGKIPTILYAYGGFESSMLPYYLSDLGKVWLEKGGAYALANIRGGGEFGPNWHSTVLKENRHRVFEDFISVSEDLIRRKITSSRHLGIRGGSNGGLLVGTVSVMRPDLFQAVSCEVPLLDMIRYPKIGAGSSWMGEYGDPSEPAMHEAIMKYSPYQNVKSGVKYPKIFFSTATSDDRVQPAHARKMAAKMLEQGHSVLFYENTDGGHSAAANLEEKVKDRALIFTYFHRQLFK